MISPEFLRISKRVVTNDGLPITLVLGCHTTVGNIRDIDLVFFARLPNVDANAHIDGLVISGQNRSHLFTIAHF